MTAFTGFPIAALDFYDDLEMDNTKSYWEAHKPTYDSAVAAPMKALTAELAESSGRQFFRPYRDVRFAKDKTPYKTAPGCLRVDRARRRAGTCRWAPRACASAPASTTRRPPGWPASARRSCTTGTARELEDILAALQAAGWTLGGHTLKTAPRGYDATIHGSSCCGTIDDARQGLRLRAVHPHPGAARPGPRRLAETRPFIDWVLRDAKG